MKMLHVSPLRNQFGDHSDGGGGNGDAPDFNASSLYPAEDAGNGGGEGGDGSGQHQQADADPFGAAPFGAQPNRQQQTPAQNQPFDFDRFGQVLGAQIGQSINRALPPQQAPQMTADEFRQHTKYYTVTADHLQALGLWSDDDALNQKRMAIMQQMLDGSATHAYNVAQVNQMRLQREIQSQIEPVSQYITQQEQAHFVRSVETLDPAFKGMGRQINMVIQAMMQQGYQPQNFTADVNAVGNQLFTMLRASNPNFQLQRNNGGGGSAGMPKMGGSVNGAGGGAGGSRSNGAPKSAGMALYGKKA